MVSGFSHFTKYGLNHSINQFSCLTKNHNLGNVPAVPRAFLLFPLDELRHPRRLSTGRPRPDLRLQVREQR